MQTDDDDQPSGAADAAASTSAVESFGFLEPDNVAGVSLATVTHEGQAEIIERKLWVVYLKDVLQPAFGEHVEVKPGDMYVLIQPVDMTYLHAESF